MADIRVNRIFKQPRIKDHRRLAIDGYYMEVEKADTAGNNNDRRQLYIRELSNAVEDELGYVKVLESFNVRIAALEADTVRQDQELSVIRARLDSIEPVVQILADGIYAYGASQADLPWTPGVNTPTDATRIPITTIQAMSNVTHPNDYGFTPQHDADYSYDLRIYLDLSSSQNNRDWTIGIFNNGVQQGPGFTFNTREISGDLFLDGKFASHIEVGEEIDVRLWSTNVTSSLVIADFTYAMEFLGIDQGIA